MVHFISGMSKCQRYEASEFFFESVCVRPSWRQRIRRYPVNVGCIECVVILKELFEKGFDTYQKYFNQSKNVSVCDDGVCIAVVGVQQFSPYFSFRWEQERNP